MAIDDYARVNLSDMRPDERKDSSESFLRPAVVHFAKMGVKVQDAMMDNEPAFHSFALRDACIELSIKQKFTRAYRPQTNGKAERFIQSALRELAYGRAYTNSDDRRWCFGYQEIKITSNGVFCK